MTKHTVDATAPPSPAANQERKKAPGLLIFGVLFKTHSLHPTWEDSLSWWMFDLWTQPASQPMLLHIWILSKLLLSNPLTWWWQFKLICRCCEALISLKPWTSTFINATVVNIVRGVSPQAATSGCDWHHTDSSLHWARTQQAWKVSDYMCIILLLQRNQLLGPKESTKVLDWILLTPVWANIHFRNKHRVSSGTMTETEKKDKSSQVRSFNLNGFLLVSPRRTGGELEGNSGGLWKWSRERGRGWSQGMKANNAKMMPTIPLGPRQEVQWVPVA